MTDSYKLVDVIDVLRADIDAAIEAAKGKTTYFELGEIEIELTTQITETGKNEGGLNIGVVKIGSSLDDSDTHTQKIKFKLIPKLKPTSDVAKEPNTINISAKVDEIPEAN